MMLYIKIEFNKEIFDRLITSSASKLEFTSGTKKYIKINTKDNYWFLSNQEFCHYEFIEKSQLIQILDLVDTGLSFKIASELVL